jgi:hypothetical protein
VVRATKKSLFVVWNEDDGAISDVVVADVDSTTRLGGEGSALLFIDLHKGSSSKEVKVRERMRLTCEGLNRRDVTQRGGGEMVLEIDGVIQRTWPEVVRERGLLKKTADRIKKGLDCTLNNSVFLLGVRRRGAEGDVARGQQLLHGRGGYDSLGVAVKG